MPITGKKCVFKATEEIEGRKTDVTLNGEVLAEPAMKSNGAGSQYLVVPIIDDKGQLHEVGIYRVKINQ